jgi:hypothetical protein
LDIFVRPADVEGTLKPLAEAGYCTELTFSHWLAKTIHGDYVMDVIFDSGNGITAVDDAWFEHAPRADVLGLPTLISPAEEMIWTEAFIMHLLRARAEQLDWRRLLDRFSANWRVLLAYLVLFGFVYPSERARIPGVVMDELLGRLREEMAAGSSAERLCRGTLFSHSQYQIDLQCWDYQDARLSPHGNMTGPEVDLWTSVFPQQ